METKTPICDEIPTALPGFEEDAREKLLLDATTQDTDGEVEDEEPDSDNESVKPKKRRWQVLRTLVGFAGFLCFLVVAISWFFGIGWFSEQKPQPISRNASKDALNSPATEDEKLKMALSMVAGKAPALSEARENPPGSQEDPSASNTLSTTTGTPSVVSDVDAKRINAGSGNEAPQYAVRVADQGAVQKDSSKDAKAPAPIQAKTLNTATGKKDVSEDARGRSSFFGITKKLVETDKPGKIVEQVVVDKTVASGTISGHHIPFGTLLPVRLIGSIYTFRNSEGFVRMELTRPVEGKGYSYPAGTKVVGNVRGGESSRAFVTIVGLIDPVSGELVRFGGDLLGRDGGSGIEGRRRKLTSAWSRFFAGLKDTATSVLGSVGAIRSGGTVIFSEPLRNSSESMSEDLSSAIFKNGKENTFIEVSAGTSGYVLVTGLPENSSAVANELRSEAGNK